MLIPCRRWNNVCNENIAEQLQLSKRGDIFNRMSTIYFPIPLLFDSHSLLSCSHTLRIYNHFFLVMFVDFQ